MKLLLDTHAFIWLDLATKKISRTAMAACQNPDNELYLSLVSAWEIQIKMQLKRLDLPVPLPDIIRAQQVDNSLQILPIRLEHIYALAKLDPHHNDPFNRLLIAQAISEEMKLVSIDSTFADYPVEVIW
jgi:PIN domain nuclease of toxin-antitoxin system